MFTRSDRFFAGLALLVTLALLALAGTPTYPEETRFMAGFYAIVLVCAVFFVDRNLRKLNRRMG